MKRPLRIRQVQIYRLAIPLRVHFEHAAAARDSADPVVVRLTAEAPYSDHIGYGETLARPYVTGETADSVVSDIVERFAPLLVEFRPASFAEALEFIDALPARDGERVMNAARAAVELALIDLAGRVFRRRAADVAGWLDLPGFGPPGCLADARYSGIVVGRGGWKLAALLRVQRCYGLRGFKIKVATAGWEQRLEWTHRLLRSALRRGRVTLRADANAAWSPAQAADALPTLERFGVSALEQPLPKTEDSRLPELSKKTKCDLIADESLVTIEDAERLIETGGVQVFNIRLAKNGGLLAALRIARMVLAAGRDVQLGCMVGETSILSAAGVAFLEICPEARFVEGAFGSLLLRDDVTRRPIRFRRGGRMRARSEFGFGVRVDPAALARLSPEPPEAISF